MSRRRSSSLDRILGRLEGLDAQNLAILARIPELRTLGRPLFLGASRKSVVSHALDLPAGERLEGTLAITSLAAWHGVELIRVHDVQANLRAARMAAAIRGWRVEAAGGGNADSKP